MIKNKSIFYANDKALNDALVQRKLKNSDLADLFISRGIIASKETDRDDLAKYFCRLNHDYFDHQRIARILGTTHRRERNNYIKAISDIETDKIESILNDVKGAIEQLGDTAEVKKIGDSLQLRIKYQSTNYSKSEFRQVSENEAIILIDMDSDGFKMRSPHAKYAKDVREMILDSVAAASMSNFKVNEIALNPALDHEKKSDFFTYLISEMKGCKLIDVVDIYVFNPLEADGKKEGDELHVHIKKASLKGQGVLNSDHLKGFKSKGFHVSKIVWTFEQNSKEALYEAEAEFSAPATCSDFSYAVKWMFPENGALGYNKTKRHLLKSDEIRFNKLIEESAFNAMNKIHK